VSIAPARASTVCYLPDGQRGKHPARCSLSQAPRATAGIGARQPRRFLSPPTLKNGTVSPAEAARSPASRGSLFGACKTTTRPAAALGGAVQPRSNQEGFHVPIHTRNGRPSKSRNRDRRASSGSDRPVSRRLFPFFVFGSSTTRAPASECASLVRTMAEPRAFPR